MQMNFFFFLKDENVVDRSRKALSRIIIKFSNCWLYNLIVSKAARIIVCQRLNRLIYSAAARRSKRFQFELLKLKFRRPISVAF